MFLRVTMVVKQFLLARTSISPKPATGLQKWSTGHTWDASQFGKRNSSNKLEASLYAWKHPWKPIRTELNRTGVSD
ncbi:hypothetical protein BRADI_3g36635v3 [Brachypodium distachyon]|uniref:Uncharacterized protein n=1 Tax=Brachypodium distachyon TaxID=15368 RepID=A0A2K2D1J1_BRADI|nr:hypothetical protein BRADI_3g36635v3 [Brachypodium distachyon]